MGEVWRALFRVEPPAAGPDGAGRRAAGTGEGGTRRETNGSDVPKLNQRNAQRRVGRGLRWKIPLLKTERRARLAERD